MQKREAQMNPEITTLFLDVGNVLLTNGWDRSMRKQAARQFDLDYEELNERHHLTFDAYEQGKISLQNYLDRVVFHQRRPFSREQFRRFMFAQSRPFPEMIDLIRQLRARYGLKIATLSNEGRELTIYRMEQFGFRDFVDTFVASCFVHCRKPEPTIYEMALDLTQARPEQSAYIDDRAMFVEVAETLGLHGIHHSGYESTREALARLGLALPVEAPVMV
jgi:putative hydrolase of the HAD superfamily